MTTPTHSHKAWTDEGGHVKLAECVMAALGSSRSLQQICRAADCLLHLADDPSQRSAARQVSVVDVQAVQERALNLLDWQELEDDDDRSDNQKLIDNATDADTVLVRDPTGTPERQEIGILELLQRGIKGIPGAPACAIQRW